jgi:hypothetical protein
LAENLPRNRSPDFPQQSSCSFHHSHTSFDRHRPSDAVDRHHVPQWQIEALLLQQPLQSRVVGLTAK